MPRYSDLIRIVLLVFLILIAPRGIADEFVVDKEQSLVGFVNHKRGFAKALIVDPLTYPSKYTMTISLNPTIDSAVVELRYAVKNLQVAGPVVLRRWGARIFKAGATAKPLQAPSKSRQRKIREVVLSKKLMDAAKYPRVTVKSLGLTKISRPAAEEPYTHEMTVDVAMHGKTVRATFPAAIVLDGDRLTVDAAFPLAQSDFGIKAYSAFFGTVRFTDGFHVYMHVEATREVRTDAAR